MRFFKMDSPHFLEEVFLEVSGSAKKSSDPLLNLLEDEAASVSFEFDKTRIQDSSSWRNVTEARGLANLIVGEKGEINEKAMEQAYNFLQSKRYSLGPGREQDGARRGHLVYILKKLLDDKAMRYQLQRISRPASHPAAEELIRDTLFIPPKATLTDAHAKRATLAALFTSLRQNVGSCFATAPAILIQQEEPIRFLSDIGQLLSTGRLTRIFSGIEHTVPLSHSWGVADLNKPFYLTEFGDKPWETLSGAPGLLAAASAAGVIDSALPKDEKKKVLFKKLKNCSLARNKEDLFLVITPGKVIEALLLDHFEITKEDLENYSSRPKEFLLPGYALKSYVPTSGKALSCFNYEKNLKRARNVFKGFTDNALLKAWEFTLASFAETKADFAGWNLYASLGFGSDAPFGIGRCFYEILQEKVERANRDIEEYQSKYDIVFAQLKSLEGRAQSAGSEREMEWVRAEYRTRNHEIGRILADRDEAYERGKKLSSLLPFLTSFYSEQFKIYFQEIYDAEMHDVKAGPYDDSPAGFRLLYKHGRANTALWTLIHNPAEYVDSLSSFFVATEIELAHLPQTKGLEHEISELVTAAVMLVRKPEFLEHSFYRLAHAYREPVINNPLENLDKIERKPWAYISGGTMTTLVNAYFGGSSYPKEESKWVESENELLAFCVDTMKDLPLNVKSKYREKQTLSMLAFSPTHAFLFQPGRHPFLESWNTDIYTYTWIRDKWIIPAKHFYESILLDTRMLDFLTGEISKTIPKGYRHVFMQAVGDFSYSMYPKEFREHILYALSYEKWAAPRLSYFSEEIDAALYDNLPLIPEYGLKDHIEEIISSLQHINDETRLKISTLFDTLEPEMGKYKILSSKQVKNVAKGLYILATEKTQISFSFHEELTKLMQAKKLASPAPILYADTNWVNNLFGFVVNPGTSELEFWRFDMTGSTGRPISQWKKWVNGSEQKTWGFFTAPHEYGL